MWQLLVWNVDYSLLPKNYTAPFEALWTMDSVGFMWHNATWPKRMEAGDGEKMNRFCDLFISDERRLSCRAGQAFRDAGGYVWGPVFPARPGCPSPADGARGRLHPRARRCPAWPAADGVACCRREACQHDPDPAERRYCGAGRDPCSGYWRHADARGGRC